MDRVRQHQQIHDLRDTTSGIVASSVTSLPFIAISPYQAIAW
ncbi:MAG: hypothetical protein AB4352_01235 [Hormoscilla sp.]